MLVCAIRLENYKLKFLWGWGYETKKIAWVSWENVCRPVQEGGLGIIDIGSFNVALLSKWKWGLAGKNWAYGERY